MQMFESENYGGKLDIIYKENEKTLEEMRSMQSLMLDGGYNLTGQHVGIKRKSPCPCGSGKKFKNCHGR